MKPKTLEEFVREQPVEITEVSKTMARFKTACEVKGCGKVLTGRTIKSLKSYYDQHMLIHVEEK